MEKLIIIITLGLLSIGCISRDNPYDPGSGDFNDELLITDMIKFSPDTISSIDGTEVTLRAINLGGSATSIHIEFDKHDLLIDSIKVLHNNENSFVTSNKNICNINFIGGIPVAGTVDIAKIYLSKLPISGRLQYTGILFNDNVSNNSQSKEINVEFWGEPVIK